VAKKARHVEMINGLGALVDCIGQILEKPKRDALETMKSEFCDSNPWFGKVMDIWTTQSKPNYQMTFWRLRYNADIKFGCNLSAEQIINTKKLDRVLSALVGRQVLKGFMDINRV
jgi:hypothetical protein